MTIEAGKVMVIIFGEGVLFYRLYFYKKIIGDNKMTVELKLDDVMPKAISALPDVQKEEFSFFIDEKGISEIAKEKGVSVNSVRQNIERAKGNLRQSILRKFLAPTAEELYSMRKIIEDLKGEIEELREGAQRKSIIGGDVERLDNAIAEVAKVKGTLISKRVKNALHSIGITGASQVLGCNLPDLISECRAKSLSFGQTSKEFLNEVVVKLTKD